MLKWWKCSGALEVSCRNSNSEVAWKLSVHFRWLLVIFDLRALCTIRGSYTSRLGRLSAMAIAQRLNKEPLFEAEFPRGHNKICTDCNRGQHEKETLLYCDTCNNLQGLHFGDCCKNTTLFKSKMKWNLRFHCHEKMHALFILSWFSVWSWYNNE